MITKISIDELEAEGALKELPCIDPECRGMLLFNSGKRVYIGPCIIGDISYKCDMCGGYQTKLLKVVSL